MKFLYSRLNHLILVEAYAHIIEPLPIDEGGGFLITLPDLPGCRAEAMETLL